MGDVYRAEDQRLRRTVALKVVRAARDPEETSRRLLAEARAGSAFTHPNIAVVYEVDEVEHDGAMLSFIAMEYVAGRTLADLAAQGPLALDTILDVGRQVADALAAAHAYGLVHQDIKPSNVMVTENGLVKVLDFGVARWSAPMVDTASTQTVDPLHGRSSRHALVHVAGADHGPATRWTQRHVLARRRDVRAARRTSSVRRSQRGAGARGAVAEGAAAAARASRRSAPAGCRAGRETHAREEPAEPLRRSACGWTGARRSPTRRSLSRIAGGDRLADPRRHRLSQHHGERRGRLARHRDFRNRDRRSGRVRRRDGGAARTRVRAGADARAPGRRSK